MPLGLLSSQALSVCICFMWVFILIQWYPQSNLAAYLSQVILCNFFFLYKIDSQSSVAPRAVANTYIEGLSVVIRPRMNGSGLQGRRPCAPPLSD